MGRSISVVAFACAAIYVAGCVEKADPITPVDRKAVERWVSKTPTEPEHATKGKFSDSIELIGYDVTPDTLKPGTAFTVTWHWKVNKPIDKGWKLFTHVADAGGRDRLNQDGEGLIRRAYQPGHWLAGEYIRDRQRITLPADWNSPAATFYVGIWKGNKRLPVTAGKHDGEHRLKAATIPVSQSTEPAKLPELTAKKTPKAPTLDGKLDEELWTEAATTERLVNTMSGEKAEPEATVKTAWDDAHLYIAFNVEDDFLKSTFDKDDDHLWEQDCVEVMVDPDGDGKNYFELQVSPQGKVFDTRYDTRRKPGPFGHTDWNTKLKNGVNVRGKVNDDEEDEGYTVEMAIPWEAFAQGTPAASKPSPGTTWRVNFYVLDAREKGQRGAGWSPPKVADFHVPSRFGKLTFVDPNAAEEPSEDESAKADPEADESAKQASEASKAASTSTPRNAAEAAKQRALSKPTKMPQQP